MGPDYAKERKLTVYTAEVHVCYVRELHLGDRVTVTFQLLDHDEKRLHVYQEIRHVDGWLAATSETLSLHVDMAARKSRPFPPTSWRRSKRCAPPMPGCRCPSAPAARSASSARACSRAASSTSSFDAARAAC